jgi:TolA-binding protein
MASYGYNNTSSSMVDQQQVDALRRELAAKDEANFDLSATLAAVEAETSHRVQQVEKESGSAVKKLEEQLRRVQQEANMARGQAVQLQNKLRLQEQQFQQQALIQNQHQKPMVTPTNMPRDTRIATTAPAPALSETTVHQPASSVNAVTPQPSKNLPISSGQRLAQHLLRTTAMHILHAKKTKKRSITARPTTMVLLLPAATSDSATCTDLQLATFCIEQCPTGKQSPVDHCCYICN